MRSKSEARYALRSLLPERYLIARREVTPLRYKYHARLSGTWIERRASWSDRDFWWPPEVDADDSYSADKYFSSLHLEGVTPSPVSARDVRTGDQLRYDHNDATLLHVYGPTGGHQMRHELSLAADYLNAHQVLRETPYVAGVTYREMGRLATRLGFKEMYIQELSENYNTDLRAVHLAYCAINDRAAPYSPAVVYLPTDEFIKTFGT